MADEKKKINITIAGASKESQAKARKKKSSAELDSIESIRKEFINDPVGFVTYFFPKLTESPSFVWQAEELNKFRKCKGINKHAYVGSTGCGKSTLICMSIIWLLVTRVAPKIVVITSTAQQSSTTIFDTLMFYLKNSVLVDYFSYAATSITLNCNDNTVKGLCFLDEADGAKSNALRGLHSADSNDGVTAVFMDEAGNFAEWVYQKIAGIMATGNSLWILSSNGGPAVGGFFRRFSMKDFGFQARKITAYDVGMSQERIDSLTAEYGGKESDMYKQMILAEFTGLEESLLTLADMQAANDRFFDLKRRAEDVEKDPTIVDQELMDTGHIFMGLDLSNKSSGRSKNCVCIRDNRKVIVWQLFDATPEEVKNTAMRLMNKYNVVRCFYDGSSVLGSQFSQLNIDRRFVRFNPGDRQNMESEYDIKRSEAVDRMCHWIKTKGALPATDKTISLFCAVRSFMKPSFYKNGQPKRSVTDKKTLEKITDSQTLDKFDALTYTFAADKTDINSEIFGMKEIKSASQEMWLKGIELHKRPPQHTSRMKKRMKALSQLRY